MRLTHLVLSDLRIHLGAFVSNLPILLFAAPLFYLLMGPNVASGIPPGMLFVASWEYTRRAAAEEDLAASWVFLRTLPLSPLTVVAVRYLSNLMAVLLYAAIALVSMLLQPYILQTVPLEAWPAVMAVSLLGSVGIMSLANAVYFRFGYKTLIATAPYFFLVPSVLGIVVLVSPLRDTRLVLALVQKASAAVKWMVDHPAGAMGLLTSLTVLVLAGSWLYATKVHSRKELG